MHIDRLHGDEWAQLFLVLDDNLGYWSRVDQRVIGVYENTFAAALLAPARDFGHVWQVGVFVDRGQVANTSSGLCDVLGFIEFGIQVKEGCLASTRFAG
jgi:hypothetical protein